MTPQQLARARQRLGLTLEEMATMLGYQGEQRRQMQYDLESGRRDIREPQRRLVEAYLAGYRPNDWPEGHKMRDRAHYIDMLERNPNATVGFTLAAKMVVAAHGSHGDDDEAVRSVARRLKREYGENLTNEQVRAEMGAE